MQWGERENSYVSGPGDVTAVKRKAKEMARAIGFSSNESEEVALVANELATNVVKHAQCGVITLVPLQDGERTGIGIESKDKGPGLPAEEKMMVDGYSTAGTLGHGMGAINRMVDTLDMTSDSFEGARIVTTKWLKPPDSTTTERRLSPYDIGAASRAHPRMTVNGDSFVIRQWSGHTLLAVIDGVGHGQYAHRASQTARTYIEAHYDQPLDRIFMGTARACRATRGVVMALIRFTWETGAIEFASVGNIESRIFDRSTANKFHLKRGIVGMNMPTPKVIHTQWESGMTLVLYSDGIDSHWNWDQMGALRSAKASVIAHRILMKKAKEADDATIAVVKERGTV